MLNKINVLYNLLFNRFKLTVDNDLLRIFPPDGIEEKYKMFAKKFVTENKDFIISTLSKNKDSPYILRFDLNNHIIPLSFAQKRLWFVEKYEGGSHIYNVYMVFKVLENTKLDILQDSIRGIVTRHEVLRTLIKEDQEGNSYQEIIDRPLEIKNIKVINQSRLDKELSKEVNHIYDLSEEYPIRVCLYQVINKDEHYLSIVIHHIAFDGWSTDIFLRELQAYYQYYLNQSQGLVTNLDLPDLSIQYKDFALWQRSYLSGGKLEQQLDYWKNKLKGYEPLNLISDNPRPSKINYEGSNAYFEVDEETSIALRELAKELKVSLYSLLLSAYCLMLRVYSNQDDIVVGTPIANRHYSQVANLIGFFVNSLVLRIKINPGDSIKKFIELVGQEIIDAQVHQDLPFEKLIEELKIDKDNARHPIFQILFAVQSFGGKLYNNTNKEQTTLTNLLQVYTTKAISYNVAKLDISTYIDDSQICLRGIFNYSLALYTEATMIGFIETYTQILKQLVKLLNSPQELTQTKILNLDYISRNRYHEMINLWNQTDRDYPNDRTIQLLFEEQAKQTPNRIAAVYKENKLTYRELNEKANRLGNYLRKAYSIKPDTLIALCLDRSEYMLIAILATLKSGGAYVPIDPAYPDERIKYILEDSKANIVLTNAVYKKRLENIQQSIFIFLDNQAYIKLNKQTMVLALDDEELQKLLSLQLITNPITTTISANLAYVIYTSGTTGNPKGVMIEHRGVVNLAAMQVEELGLTNVKDIKKCLWYANYVFDAHVWEVYVTLLNGHILYIADNDIRLNIKLLSTYIQHNSINIATIPPALLNDTELFKLDILVVTGDKTSKKVLDYYQSNNVKVINGYGPTEVTVGVSLNHYNNNGFTNIGSPIYNMKCYVLNTSLKPLPIGAIGELYIGGAGLARGYLNRSELTAERFITNPFQSIEERRENRNSRLYRTGDLVRWLPDGNLEYIGRNDFQVKIRGYRIELSEIESVLSSYEGVKQSAVIARKHKTEGELVSKYLVGYYVADIKLDEDNILNYLQSKLPEYMLPSILVHLEELPLTINGKLDRKALPDPELTSSIGYVEPRNEMEAKVCSIWAEVLGLDEDKVGILDDFFKLGGDSILAIKLASKLNNSYQSYLKIADIFIYRSIEQLLPRIIQTKDSYQTIIKLNNSVEKPNLFMIHPASVGCEIYTSLANRLVNSFSCYGVDSYNLYNKDKITDLNELAKYYLSHIDEVMLKTHQKEYHLLGWSLGGQIVLEIASILEQKGYPKIKLYLLDTILYDPYLLAINNSVGIDTEEKQKEYRDALSIKGWDQSYIERIILNMDIEDKLIKQKITSILTNTYILLFKTMLEDTRVKIDNNNSNINLKEVHEYLLNLQYNNIDTIVKNKSSIKVKKAHNAHHGNILDQEEDFLAFEIGSALKYL